MTDQIPLRRTTENDQQWQEVLEVRQKEAKRRMAIEDHKKGFVALSTIMRASGIWNCSQHEAEQRLMRGDLPEGLI